MRDTRARHGVGRSTFASGLGVIVLVATAARFWGIVEREPWFDENCTFYVVHHWRDWPTTGPLFQQEVGHLPYYFLLHIWTRLTGESILGLRTFSAVAGVLAVAGAAAVGRLVGGRQVGLIAGSLAAVNPLAIYYSQEARSYSFWVLCVTLCLYCLCRAALSGRLESHDNGRSASSPAANRWRLPVVWWAAFVATAGLSFMTHYYSLLCFPGTLAAVLMARDRGRFIRQWLLSSTVLLLACVPAIWFLVVPLAGRGPRPWLREIWLAYPPYAAVAKSLWAMLPSGGYPAYLGPLGAATELAGSWASFGPLLHWGPAVFLLILVTVVIGPQTSPRPAPALQADGGQHATKEDDCRARLAFMVLLSLSFLCIAFAYSVLAEPVYVVGRYDLAAWPSLTVGTALLIELAITRTVARSKNRAAFAAAVTTALCACSAVTISAAGAVPRLHSNRDRATKIAAMVRANDFVVSLNQYELFMLHEWWRLAFAPEVIAFPPRHGQQLCWQNAEAELGDPDAIHIAVHQVSSRIADALDHGRRVWILAHGAPVGPRWDVDRQLFDRLRQMSVDVRPVADEGLGLAELVKLPASPVRH